MMLREPHVSLDHFYFDIKLYNEVAAFNSFVDERLYNDVRVSSFAIKHSILCDFFRLLYSDISKKSVKSLVLSVSFLSVHGFALNKTTKVLRWNTCKHTS
jgi:hypothetical protein